MSDMIVFGTQPPVVTPSQQSPLESQGGYCKSCALCLIVYILPPVNPDGCRYTLVRLFGCLSHMLMIAHFGRKTNSDQWGSWNISPIC